MLLLTKVTVGAWLAEYWWIVLLVVLVLGLLCIIDKARKIIFAPFILIGWLFIKIWSFFADGIKAISQAKADKNTPRE